LDNDDCSSVRVLTGGLTVYCWPAPTYRSGPSGRPSWNGSHRCWMEQSGSRTCRSSSHTAPTQHISRRAYFVDGHVSPLSCAVRRTEHTAVQHQSPDGSAPPSLPSPHLRCRIQDTMRFTSTRWSTAGSETCISSTLTAASTGESSCRLLPSWDRCCPCAEASC